MGRVIAFLFLVHAALFGFSAPAAAELMPRDQFGNVLCLSGEIADAHKGSGRDHGHVPLKSCCSASCAMHGGPLPPPTLLSRLVRQPLVLSVPFVLYEDVGSGAVETPRKTRGPPRLA